MFVMTVDQRGSRRVGDRVDELLAALTRHAPDGAPGVVRGFERTVGDEVQGVLDDPEVVVDLTLRILRTGAWSVGLGVGPVDQPLPTHARAGSGKAFVLAREAVERAKGRRRSVPVAVEAAMAQHGRDCEAVLTMLAVLIDRRTDAGWAVVDAVAELGSDATQEDVADRLGISQQAVSQRLRTALWNEEQAVRPVVARLLAEGEQ